MGVELTTTRLEDAAKWAKQSILDRATNWGRKFSLFTYPFVTACCGMEFMSVAGPKYDLARFGAEFPRFSPRELGADQVIPVDVYIPGCPPRPEQVLDALIMLMDRVQSGRGHSQLRAKREQLIVDAGDQ